MQLHGQAASILKCKQTITIMMKECSSRNTVQFLDKIDRNHEYQPRNYCVILREYYIVRYFGILLTDLKKKYMFYNIYTYIYSNAWKLLEFPALGDLRSCVLKCLRNCLD